MFQQMLKVKKYMYYDSVILKDVLNQKSKDKKA